MPFSKKKGGNASHLQKRSLSISGHATSIALEKEFWDILESAAQRKKIALSKFISNIDSHQREGRPLTSTLRLKALEEAFLSANKHTSLGKYES
ncbi:aryl-sulfate sulfotransferase [Acetobacteraceae bacterium]|nr:aryl-sulfate sulfotransferase [Acetobacteraceae bacterium]